MLHTWQAGIESLTLQTCANTSLYSPNFLLKVRSIRERECVLCFLVVFVFNSSHIFWKTKGKKLIKKRAKTKEVELFSFPRLGRAFSVIMTLHLFRLWVFLLPSKRRSILGTFPYSAQFGLTRFPHPILIISADKRSFPEFLLQLSEYHSCKLNSINSKVFVLCVFKLYLWYLFIVLEYLLFNVSYQ